MERLSISLPEHLAREVRDVAREDGLTLSSLVAAALAKELRLRHARAAIAEWEGEHGAISAEELERVRARWR